MGVISSYQSKLRYTQLVIIVFCYLFRFVLFKGTVLESILDSSVLVFLYLLLQLVLSSQYPNYVLRELRNWYVQKLLIMYFGILLIALFICFKEFLFSYLDVGFIKTWLLVGIQITIGIFVYAYLKMKKGNVLNILVSAYILQACIQLISFVSPAIWSILNRFRTNNVISLSGSIRGMSLDRYDYFNLACGYCLIYIILVFRWNTWNINTYWKKLAGYILLIYGGLASARTSMVIMALSVGAYITKEFFCKSKIRRRNNIVTILLFIAVVSAGVFFMLKYYRPAQAMFDFLFIHIINYIENRELTNPSTQQLFGEMYFSIPLITLFMGDGHFLNEHGGYYKHTDAGYMRMILYGGVFISILLLVFQLMFLDNRLISRERKLEKFFIVFMILILNIKGIVIGCQTLLLPMLFLLFLSDRDKNAIDLVMGENHG